MKYVPPIGKVDDVGYVDGNPALGLEGDAVPAAALEHPMREIVQVIKDAGLTPETGDLKQLSEAIRKLNAGIMDMAFIAGSANDGSDVDLAVQKIGGLALARPAEIKGVFGKVGVEPTGTAIQLDVRRNGTSIFTVLPHIVAGTKEIVDGTLDPAQVNCAANDVLEIFITQVGSTIRGQRLTLTVKANAIGADA
ncbi:hypothetical protein [Kiloniella majae]|uniref:hypothetical protein n=1 Tax=Kiloniella majae TaxID=1938558 RepID=UPI000A277854|nr:hypothetical protein [Kiloniella majae]